LWLRRAFVAAALFAFVMATLPKPPELPGDPGDKVQHMLAFFTLGSLAALGWRGRSAWHLLAVLAIFGAAIEVVQMIPALHRDSQLSDWLADMAAAIVSIALVRLVILRAR
jgi:VanZ family protein